MVMSLPVFVFLEGVVKLSWGSFCTSGLISTSSITGSSSFSSSLTAGLAAKEEAAVLAMFEEYLLSWPLAVVSLVVVAPSLMPVAMTVIVQVSAGSFS